MALVKRKTRKKLAKQLNKLVRKHGKEAALALVTGIVSNLTTDSVQKAEKKQQAPSKPVVVRPKAAARAER